MISKKTVLKLYSVLVLAIFQLILPAASADGADHRAMPFDSHQLVTRDADQDLSGTVSGLSSDVVGHDIAPFLRIKVLAEAPQVSRNMGESVGREGRIPLHNRAFEVEFKDGLSSDSLARLWSRPVFRSVTSLHASSFPPGFLKRVVLKVEQLLEQEDIKKFSKLEKINFSSRHLGKESCLEDADLAAVTRLVNPGLVNTLILRDSKSITDSGLVSVAKLTGLTSLDLRSCDKITDAGLALLSTLTELKNLNLPLCDKITDAGLAHLASLTALTILNVASCANITGVGLGHLAGLNQLTSLDLTWCGQITDRDIAPLAGLTQLTNLNLTCCSEITDVSLDVLAGLTHLTNLNLRYCHKITDAGLVRLARLTQLRSIDLFGCDQITDEAISKLKKAIPGIEISDPQTTV